MLTSRLELHGVMLSALEESRIRRHLDGLGRRLARRPDPTATLVLTGYPNRHMIEASLRVQLGPLGGHLMSEHLASTANRAARLTIEDVKRQLERRLAAQRGEPSFGVPSRRRPRAGLTAATLDRSATTPLEEHPDEGWPR